ncbi:MAG: Dienelactone hydrolase-like enzyme [Sphingomonadales bacterium]|nr:Dienelactone hydrolase-like enzyme [Sphingomonadales bacterium]
MDDQKPQLQQLSYTCRDQPFTGLLAFDEAIVEPRPGILIVHDAWGIADNVKMRAGMLAGLGYVALCADIYGDDECPANIGEAQQQVDKFRADPQLLRDRARAALDALAALPQVDASRLVAIGYCFGGMTVLEMARAGAPCLGIVSFHGLLKTSLPAAVGRIGAKLLVCTGGEDPLAPMDDVAAFQQEMREADADCQTIIYSGAKHSFANPFASDNPGMGHHPDADRRSWAAMLNLFDEVFGSPQ